MNDRAGVRTIAAAPPPTRFARGWHCLGLAAKFRASGPHAVEAFGTKLVVFSDTRGELHVLDAFCRHMGGDLTMGTIKGDQVACPFHDWRWGGDGKCAHIPYARRVPPAARTRSWLTLEENKQLFVWNDPEGNPPAEHITIPRIDGAFSPEWSNWTWDAILVQNSNCREVVDNVVDMAHFFYIHFAFPTFFKNVFEGHIASQYLTTRSRPDVDTGSTFLLQWGAIVKKPPGVTDEQADKIAAKFADFISLGFQQDVEIWTHKTKIDNPLLCAEDGPVYQLRRWYEQFYVDVADITPDMVARHEYEIDTTRAVQSWQAEVTANLAARASATTSLNP